VRELALLVVGDLLLGAEGPELGADVGRLGSMQGERDGEPEEPGSLGADLAFGPSAESRRTENARPD